MAVEIAVHRAMPCDASLLAALHASCFAQAWDETAMAQFIAGPDTLCLLASAADESAGAPAGLLIARKAADEAELLTLGVVPACRGPRPCPRPHARGHGRAPQQRRYAAFP